MTPTPPFWFKQRQCKAEPADNGLKVTGPNLGEAFLRVAPSGQAWDVSLRLAPDGDDIATAPGQPSPAVAWDVAFELYRTHVIT
jgi:hypothetical protein